jgi:hypothetical protein
MPVIAAVLFEFTLRELKLRTANRADRQLTALRWIHPAERLRVQLRLTADDQLSAQTATRQVRVDQAARRLYRLRLALGTHDQAAKPGTKPGQKLRKAERRAHAALTRASFADPTTAAEVLRQVQILTLTRDLAQLDFSTADAARTIVSNLITIPDENGDRDHQLVAAATRIVAEAAQRGDKLSQSALAEKLRGQGHSIANDRLRWLSVACGLESRHG